MAVRGIGAGLPGRVVTSAEIEKELGIPAGWIRARSGIERRYIATDGEDTVTLGVRAARAALEDAGVEPGDVDLIVVATCTPAQPIPSTACLIQDALGCGYVAAFDVAAACAGFVYALVAAAGMMSSGQHRCALVIGTEALSTVTDPTDPGTRALLADGAGAIVLSPTDDPDRGISHYTLGVDGGYAEILGIPAGGSSKPATEQTVQDGEHYLQMEGKGVARFALTVLPRLIRSALEAQGLSMDDLGLIVPHQMNGRLIASVADRLAVPREKLVLNIEEHGNTSAASIPIALHEARAEGRLAVGDWVLLLGLGAGLTWGSTLLRY